MIARLSETDVTIFLSEHPDWAVSELGRSIHRNFKFADFRQAMSFMNKVAELCNVLDHHPDWCNTYNRVEVTLTTHSANALTARDITLARSMDAIAATVSSDRSN